jgi:hypothetical protein
MSKATPAVRKLSVLDGMILIAALAGWFASVRYFAGHSNLRNIWYPWDYGITRIYRNQISLLLAILSLAVVIIRLRSPRPTRPGLLRQPGFAACLASVFALGLGALSQALATHAGMGDWQAVPRMIFWQAWPYSGPAVLGAWLTLRLTRRWRPERSAIDRLGRVIGWLWIFQFFTSEVLYTRWIRIGLRLIERNWK